MFWTKKEERERVGYCVCYVRVCVYAMRVFVDVRAQREEVGRREKRKDGLRDREMEEKIRKILSLF